MIKRPDGIGAFEFSVLSALRTGQLRLGCTPRVAVAEKMTVTAQQEVAQRKVVRLPTPDPAKLEASDEPVR